MSQDLYSKNYIYTKKPEYVKFCDTARDFFEFLQDEDKSKYDTDNFIMRPYSYQMTRPFAESLGMDLSIMDESPYYSNIFRFFFTGPTAQRHLRPHLDTFSDKGICPAALNFPLDNCDDRTKTTWYRIVNGEPVLLKNSGGKINSAISSNYTPDASDCELEVVDEVCFQNNQPHLFKTSKWHEVNNTTDDLRLTAHLLFSPPMLWEDIVEHLKRIEVI